MRWDYRTLFVLSLMDMTIVCWSAWVINQTLFHFSHFLPSKLFIKYTSFLSILPSIALPIMQRRKSTTCSNAWLLWVSYLHFPPLGYVWKLNMTILTATGRHFTDLTTSLASDLDICFYYLSLYKTSINREWFQFWGWGWKLRNQSFFLRSPLVFFKDLSKSVHLSRVQYIFQCHRPNTYSSYKYLNSSNERQDKRESYLSTYLTKVLWFEALSV